MKYAESLCLFTCSALEKPNIWKKNWWALNCMCLLLKHTTFFQKIKAVTVSLLGSHMTPCFSIPVAQCATSNPLHVSTIHQTWISSAPWRWYEVCVPASYTVHVSLTAKDSFCTSSGINTNKQQQEMYCNYTILTHPSSEFFHISA